MVIKSTELITPSAKNNTCICKIYDSRLSFTEPDMHLFHEIAAKSLGNEELAIFPSKYKSVEWWHQIIYSSHPDLMSRNYTKDYSM